MTLASSHPQPSPQPAPDEARAVGLAFPGATLRVARHHLLLDSATLLSALSSAPHGGGMLRTRRILSSHVPRDVDCSEPVAMLERRAAELGVGQPFIGMLTAVDLRRAAVVERRDLGVTTLAIVTAGIGNASRAGQLHVGDPAAAGTINTIVLVDAQPGPGAFVNGVGTATEAKTLAIIEAGIRAATGEQATGTSTDAIVLAATMRGAVLPYAGPATALGASIGAAVYEATMLALRHLGPAPSHPGASQQAP